MYGGKWWMQYLKNISCHKHLALLIFHAIKSISPTFIITSNLSRFLVIKEMLFPSYFFVIKQIYLLPIGSPDVIHFRCNKIYIEYIFFIARKIKNVRCLWFLCIHVYMNFFLIASTCTNTNMSWNPAEVDYFTVFRVITVLYILNVWLVDIDIIKKNSKSEKYCKLCNSRHLYILKSKFICLCFGW